MAGGIANAQQNGLLLSPSSLQSFFPPGKPIDRIVGVLQKIGAGLIDEPVGTSVFSHLESQLLDFLHSTVYGVKSEGRKSVRGINPLECADPSALSLFATGPGYGLLEKGKTAAVKPPQTKG